MFSSKRRDVDIVIGNTNIVVGPNQNKWKLFVTNYEEAVKAVEIFLHPTFNPNHFILKEYPFEFESVGWGTFDITLKVHFVDCQKKEYTHELSFEDEPTMKSYSVSVDNLPRPRIEQMTIDDPRLLPAIERKAHELKLQKRSQNLSSKEEIERLKAREFNHKIEFSYSFFERKPTKGNPTKKEELTIQNSLMKYEKYRAICGDKRGRIDICKALETEKQKKILEFVRKNLDDLPYEDQQKKAPKGKGKVSYGKMKGNAKISFSFSQPDVMGGGFDISRDKLKSDEEAHMRIKKVLEFVKEICGLGDE